MENDYKKSIGKLYEKFLITKNFSNQLEVAVADNSLTGQEEFVIVWCDPNDSDRKMPLAQLLTGRELENYMTPDFTKSFIANELFSMYEKFDDRKTIDQLDENLEGDENYENMLKTYDDSINLAKALMNEDEILNNLEKLLDNDNE